MENQSGSSYQYQSYLVRLWQDGEDVSWRISVSDVATGEKRFFDGLEPFFVYLQAQTKTAVHHNPSFSQDVSNT